MFYLSTKRDEIGLALILIIGFCSLFLWRTVSMFILSKEEHISFFEPFLWISLLSICFLIGAVLWKQWDIRLMGVLLTVLPGLFFFSGWEYVLMSFVGSFILYRSSKNIALEEEKYVQFSFIRSVRSGSTSFLIGLVLLFSTSYYLFLRETVWEDLVPRFRVSQGVMNTIFKVAGVINPNLTQLAEGDTTVDEFLLDIEKKQKENKSEESVVFTEQIQDRESQNVSVSSVIEQQFFLEQGRKQISQFVGRRVDGSEKIVDILSPIIQDKLTAFLQSEQVLSHISSQTASFLIALLLFVTLITFVSVLSPFYIFLAYLLFCIMVKAKLLVLETVIVEKQRLQE